MASESLPSKGIIADSLRLYGWTDGLKDRFFYPLDIGLTEWISDGWVQERSSCIELTLQTFEYRLERPSDGRRIETLCDADFRVSTDVRRIVTKLHWFLADADRASIEQRDIFPPGYADDYPEGAVLIQSVNVRDRMDRDTNEKDRKGSASMTLEQAISVLATLHARRVRMVLEKWSAKGVRTLQSGRLTDTGVLSQVG